ncbi:MAG TPA: hypothetical protein VEK15_04270 [Vicinamibacteria bacterium]|nr:hypothetical protein [Vicinamibacteria bacterium]
MTRGDVALTGGRGKPERHPVLLLLLAAFFVVLLRTAWICDDAYITFRTVENLLDGFGLRYNPAERVQTYTHPLWLFLLLPFRLLTGELYFASLALGLVCSLAAVGVLAFGVARDFWAGALGLAALVFSKSFVDYSTSGMENPLAHLLLALFFLVYTSDEADSNPRRLYFLAGLLTLTRMDLGLLVIPPLFDVIRHHRLRRGFSQVIIGLVPLLLWEVFSLVYYGFAFPNTAYAKLGGGIPRLELAAQGGLYVLDSLAADPLTLTMVCGALLFVFVEKNRHGATAMLGAGLYLSYVVAIGGDFMSGRFFSAVGFVAVLTLVHRVALEGWIRAAAFGVVLVVGFSAPHPPILSGSREGIGGEGRRAIRGIVDERAFYFPYTGLVGASRPAGMPRHPWAMQGLRAREKGDAVVFRDTIGMFGFYAGPSVHVVDYYGLADALLARLPSRADPNWRPGHFARAIPPGYRETLSQGSNRLDDQQLLPYYEALRKITREPLFSRERWLAILSMNLGTCSDHVPFDRYRYAGRERVRLTEITVETGDVRELSGAGLRIELSSVRHAPLIEVSLDCDDDYELRYLRAGEPLGVSEVSKLCQAGGGIIRRTVEVPEAARTEGYDVIWLVPTRGFRPFRTAQLRLLR